jgi:hypothetical protein
MEPGTSILLMVVAMFTGLIGKILFDWLKNGRNGKKPLVVDLLPQHSRELNRLEDIEDNVSRIAEGSVVQTELMRYLVDEMRSQRDTLNDIVRDRGTRSKDD